MTSSAHCLVCDLLSRAGQKVLFTELLSLRIIDFAWEIGFKEASQDPSYVILLLPSGFCC
jgi:hypothetical protein